MSSKMMAKIKWLTEEQGGRQTIPWGDKYGPIVIIKGDLLNQTEAVWSLLVSNKESVSEFETIAEIKYLFENAPNNLYAGIEFELYEGNKLVANGIVL